MDSWNWQDNPYYSGMHESVSAPLGNGTGALLSQQYDPAAHCAVDRIANVIYPCYHRECRWLGARGIWLEIRHSRYAYLPYVESDSPDATGVSVDFAWYEPTAHAFRMRSHKGFWQVDSCTRIGQRGETWGQKLWRIRWSGGKLPDGAQIRISADIPSGRAVGSDTLTGVREIAGRRAELWLRIPGGTLVGEAGVWSWSLPVEAAELELALEFGFGAEPVGLPEVEWTDFRQPELPELSRMILADSIQHDGAHTYLGAFYYYEGAVWLRDSIFAALCLLRDGNRGGAHEVMEYLRTHTLKRDDGNYVFCLDALTGKAHEHTFENDSAGLLLAGAAEYLLTTGEALAPWSELLQSCADWIGEHTAPGRLLPPCAGIWETFGPHLGAKHEHMSWTNAISAWGLLQLGALYEQRNDAAKARQCRELSARIVANLREKCTTPEGALQRSSESSGSDASLALFGGFFPLFDAKTEYWKTLEKIEADLTDPNCGGIRRHGEWLIDRGDMVPWPPLSIWLAFGWLAAGETERAEKHLAWVVRHLTREGLIAESLESRYGLQCAPIAAYGHGMLLAYWRETERGNG